MKKLIISLIIILTIIGHFIPFTNEGITQYEYLKLLFSEKSSYSSTLDNLAKLANFAYIFLFLSGCGQYDGPFDSESSKGFLISSIIVTILHVILLYAFYRAPHDSDGVSLEIWFYLFPIPFWLTWFLSKRWFAY